MYFGTPKWANFLDFIQDETKKEKQIKSIYFIQEWKMKANCVDNHTWYVIFWLNVCLW